MSYDKEQLKRAAYAGLIAGLAAFASSYLANQTNL